MGVGVAHWWPGMAIQPSCVCLAQSEQQQREAAIIGIGAETTTLYLSHQQKRNATSSFVHSFIF